MENLSRDFQKKKKKRKRNSKTNKKQNMKSFITQFKIEVLVLFTGCREVLAKIPGK